MPDAKTSSLPLDQNYHPVGGTDYLVAERTVVFDGATADDPGEFDGANAEYDLFTVTGPIACKILAVCGTLLEGASATLEVGTAATTAGLIALTTATAIDANELWHDATPDASVEASTVLTEKIVTQNIQQKVATADITAGTITYYLLWRPLSADANVTPTA